MSQPAFWSDGFPVVRETEGAVAAFLDRIDIAPDTDLGKGLTPHAIAVQAVRAGCKPEYLPFVVAAVEAVLDPAFHVEHLASPLSTWPAFVVNGPMTTKIGLYSGIYVLASFRQANATIGRAISLALANGLPGIADGSRAVLGNAARMAGLVIAEKEDTAWDPLHVLLGFGRDENTVTAFSTFQGSPLQILPQGSRFRTAPRVAALFAEQCAYGWCGPGTQMILLSPNAQRVFLADRWTKQDLQAYLREHAKVSVAQLKRDGRWRDDVGTDSGARITLADEQRYYRLCDEALWSHLRPLLGGADLAGQVDFLPVLAGSEVAHMYTHVFYPYPSQLPKPVTKRVRSR
jgi:hypothetical protein